MTHLRKLFPLLLFIGFLLAYLPPQLAAQSENRAALVVDMGGGNVQTKCVSFSEDQITGYDLLQRSGLGLVVDVQGGGALVCSIGGTGCPAENCLCQCTGGGDCVYWSYWHKISGSWQYSQGGSSMYPIKNGMVDGWSWGLGAVNEASPPPNLAFEDVCQVAATATPTAVPPTDTPMPTPTATLAPTLAPEIAFTVDANTLEVGSCTNLRWQTANISAVYLNGGGVIGTEVRQICPTKTETYGLKVVHPGGEETRSLTVTVLESAVTVIATAVPPTEVVATAVSQPNVVPAANSGVSAANSGVSAANSATPTPQAIAVVTEATDIEAMAATDTSVAPTLPPSATPEINWVVVAAQPTETAAPTAETIAALPPSSQSETIPADRVGEMGEDGGETAVFWSSYIGFLVIILSLSLLIVQTVQKNR